MHRVRAVAGCQLSGRCVGWAEFQNERLSNLSLRMGEWGIKAATQFIGWGIHTKYQKFRWLSSLAGVLYGFNRTKQMRFRLKIYKETVEDFIRNEAILGF